MVTEFVADANVFIAGILSEKDSPTAVRLFTSATAIYIPTLCQTEVAHIILRKYRQGFLRREEAEAAFTNFLSLPSVSRYPDPVFDEPIFSIAMAKTLGANDLIYALLAQRLKVPLVTADGGLLENARSLCQCIDLRSL